MMGFLALLLILYVLSDTATQGKVTAVARGTTTGVARTGARAARAGTRNAIDGHRAYLASGKAPLGRTRLAAGRAGRGTARAVWTGARDGSRTELARLRERIDEARAEAAAARADAQDPAVGVTRGRLGRSFDQPPKHRAAPRATAAAPPATTPVPAPAAAGPETSTTSTPTSATPSEGITSMSAMTTGTGGPSVRVESLPGWLAAVEQLAALGQEIHEGGVALGIKPAAQAGLQDAVDTLRSTAQAARQQYDKLIEAADSVHQDAGDLTIAQARTE